MRKKYRRHSLGQFTVYSTYTRLNHPDQQAHLQSWKSVWKVKHQSKISSERNMVSRLKGDIKQLNFKLAQLQVSLEEKETQLHQLRSSSLLATEVIVGTDSSSNLLAGSGEPTVFVPASSHVNCVSASAQAGEREPKHSEDIKPDDTQVSTSKISNHSDTENDAQREEEFPEVRVDFQETFLGHTSPISRCRFSATGDNVASASVDGTVRIWTYDSSAPTSRNATIYCGAEIMSLEWECKSDRLLLIGTADGGIKAWNVDAKRVVCDLSCTEAFPSVLDLKCSPVEPIFVSAAASRWLQFSCCEKRASKRGDPYALFYLEARDLKKALASDEEARSDSKAKAQ
uniref:Uncharacterized protein n=1 Tax=Solanum lycopersicum TaxID=4081 RepID=A0A3Q7JUH2_SOLLC